MRTVFQVGITGGIGSGKSLITRIFSLLGIPVYDADSRAKMLMTADPLLVASIRAEFGEQSYDGGNLNRVYVAREVFSKPARLEKLNSLVHPRVAEDYKRWVQANEAAPYVLKEAALLYESGSYASLDRVILVMAPLELRVERVLKRDSHRTREQVIDIINRQWSDEEKANRADNIIYNDETRLVIPQVLALHQQFRAFVH